MVFGVLALCEKGNRESERHYRAGSADSAKAITPGDVFHGGVDMFIFFLIVVLLIPATMIGFGLSWRNNPPKTVNATYGYRTSRSMKSRGTWEFAHRYAAVVWLIAGTPLCILSIVILSVFRNYGINELGIIVIIIVAVQMVGLFLPILPTEAALRRNFDENGKRKQ